MVIRLNFAKWLNEFNHGLHELSTNYTNFFKLLFIGIEFFNIVMFRTSDTKLSSMENFFSLRQSVLLILCGHLLLGIGYIAFLPPWEGFDETAHYSSMQQIAETGTIPRYGSAVLSAEVEGYAKKAPFPYSGSPPVEDNGGYTYRSFFEAPKEIIEEGRKFIRNQPFHPRQFVEGKSINWQSQHPPLYYLILSPIYLITKNLSWVDQLFIFRSISFLFAWLALVIGALSFFEVLKNNSKRMENHTCFWALVGIGIWPLILPSWFTDMARMGNDSLCAFIIALLWLVLVRYENKHNFTSYIIIGALLGLGCLIKAFFVPIVASVVIYLTKLHWVKEGMQGLKVNVIRTMLMLVIIFMIAGWWYYFNWLDYGILLGSDELIRLKNMGGTKDNFFRNVSLLAWFRGHAAAVTTFAWSGSWSFARPNYIFLAPMSLMVLFLLCVFGWQLYRLPVTRLEWLPAWITLPILFGLSYHVVVRIALIGEGRGTGGYYLHFLVVPLTMALGVVLKKIWYHSRLKIITYIFFSYAVAFSAIMIYVQLLLFSGKLHIKGDSKFYRLTDSVASLFDFPDILSHLNVVVFPIFGFILLTGGVILVVFGLRIIGKTGLINREFTDDGTPETA